MATLLYLDPTFMTTALAVWKLLGWQRTLADTLYIKGWLENGKKYADILKTLHI